MKEFKRFVAGLAILGVVIISVIIAFRLAPETWAVLAGIVFGVVAALPMCAIVVLLLRQRPAPPPAPPVTPTQPQIIMLHPGMAADPRYMAQMPAAPMLPAPPAYAWPMPAPGPRQAAAPPEWLDAEPEDDGAAWEPAPYATPARVMAPAAPARPTYRILGDS